MRTRRMLCTYALLTACVALCGCASSLNDAQGKREALYEMGTLKASISAPVNRVYEAAQQTLKDLDLATLGAKQDGIAAELLSRNAQGQEIAIRLGALPDSKTQLHIHVGMFGDKNKSIVLLRHIKDNL